MARTRHAQNQSQSLSRYERLTKTAVRLIQMTPRLSVTVSTWSDPDHCIAHTETLVLGPLLRTLPNQDLDTMQVLVAMNEYPRTINVLFSLQTLPSVPPTRTSQE